MSKESIVLNRFVLGARPGDAHGIVVLFRWPQVCHGYGDTVLRRGWT